MAYLACYPTFIRKVDHETYREDLSDMSSLNVGYTVEYDNDVFYHVNRNIPAGGWTVVNGTTFQNVIDLMIIKNHSDDTDLNVLYRPLAGGADRFLTVPAGRIAVLPNLDVVVSPILTGGDDCPCEVLIIGS